MAQLENIRIQRIMEWLISEVERLRSEVKGLQESGRKFWRYAQENRGRNFNSYGPECADFLRAISLKPEAVAPAQDERAYRDFHRWVLDNLVCSGGPDNSPCRLEQSDDPNEHCLFHKALAIGRTRDEKR